MKNKFLRLISLLLLLAMLLPLAAACKKDPPPNKDDGDDTENGGEQKPEERKFVKVVQTGTKELVLFDPENMANTLSDGSPYSAVVDNTKGKPAIKWSGSSRDPLKVNLPAAINVGDYYYLEFELYTENGGITVNVNIAQKNVSYTLEKGGWTRVKIRTEEYCVRNPYYDTTYIELSYAGGNENIEVYLSKIVATKPQYELSVPEGLDISNPEYYDAITKNAREFIVGNGVAIDSPVYTSKLTAYQSDAISAWEHFKNTYTDEAGPGVVFGIPMGGFDSSSGRIEPKNGVNITAYYAKIEAMAKGYACLGTSTHKNAELLADVKKGLEYGYKYYFGQGIVYGEKHPTNPTVDVPPCTTYGNWYDWDIAIPARLVNILVLIEDALTPEETAKYLKPFDMIITHPTGAAANRATVGKIVLLSAALKHDAFKLAETNALLEELFVYVDERPADAPIDNSDGGFCTDGSFIQHGGIRYAGVYGTGFLGALSQTMLIASGTPFEMSCEGVEHQYEWIFNAYRTILYDDSMMAMTFGRQIIQRNMEKQYLCTLLCHTAAMRSYAPDGLKDDFDSLNKYLIDVMEAEGYTSWIESVPFPFLKYCLDLKANTNITYEYSLNKTIVFGCQDAVVHHGAEYGVALSMSSTRIYKYESINGNNETGWYHGDGMLYLYTDGYDYGFHHFWYADPYLMQGTTVNLAQRSDSCITPMIYNSDPYAGGVSQGKYGVAGYILGYPDDYLLWDGRPLFDPKNIEISAKKSYFFFDNEVVCLGSGITDESDCGVITTVENRLWGLRGATACTDELYINGTRISEGELSLLDRSGYTTEDLTYLGKPYAPSDGPSIPQTTVDARTMHFSNMGGYVFLRAKSGVSGDGDGNVIRYAKATNNPYATVGDPTLSEAQFKSTQDFLEIVIDHSEVTKNGDAAKYAYVYLPEATVQETEDYYAKYITGEGDIDILARNDSVHSVIEKNLKIIACNFFVEGGTAIEDIEQDCMAVTEISSQTPCSLMITKNADGSYSVAISDPTQTYSSLTLSIVIEGISEVTSTDAGVSATISGSTLNISVSSANSLGSAFNLTVK